MRREQTFRLALTAPLLVVLCWSGMMFGQTSTVADGNKLLQASKWKEAEQVFAAIVAREPSDGAAWSGLGEAQLQQKEFSSATQSFSRAVDLKFRILLSRINVARVAAAQGDKPQLLSALHAIVASGLGPKARAMLRYPEFDPYRSDPDFLQIATVEMLPCREPHFREFDFWIGEWQVYDPQQKQLLGHNSVTREQEGCLLVEHWKSSLGVESGMSFNYFDNQDSTWHQLYIDNSGNARAYPPMSGTLVDGRMTLLSALDKGSQSRWTWYVIAPGKVRQMAEQTKDSGKTWTTSWDSVYVKE